MRILIAEGDFTSRNMLASALKKAGHEPVETVNGLERHVRGKGKVPGGRHG